MRQIGQYFTYLFLILISKLPFAALYRLSDILAFVLYRIVKYRKNVVIGNLQKAFPHKNAPEIEQISHQFYTHFADIVLEGIKNFSLSPQEAAKRFTIKNPEIVLPYLQAGKTVITLTAHYGNWEGYALSAPIHLPQFPMCMFYKPLSNSYLNQKARISRARTGTHLVALHDTFTFFETQKNTPKLVVLVADQSPSKHDKAYWVNFLGIETACLHGPEKYAKQYNCPVVYLDIQRQKRGFYQVTATLLTNQPNTLPQGAITQLYFDQISSVIQQNPANWLWSHKRWKQQKN